MIFTASVQNSLRGWINHHLAYSKRKDDLHAHDQWLNQPEEHHALALMYQDIFANPEKVIVYMKASGERLNMEYLLANPDMTYVQWYSSELIV